MIILSRKEWDENNLEFYLDNLQDEIPNISLFFKCADLNFKLVHVEDTKRNIDRFKYHLEEITNKKIRKYHSTRIYNELVPWTSVEISREDLNKVNIFCNEKKAEEERERERNRIKQIEEEKLSRNILDNGSILTNKGFTELLYLAHQDNAESILKHGILSKNEVKKNKLKTTDFSLESAQDKREEITDSFHKKNLHDYVPLCFTQKLPMLFSIRHMQNDLLIIHIDTQSLIKENRCLFSNGNMASPSSDLFENYIDDDSLYSLIKEESWNRATGEHIKIAAEVLIDSMIVVKYISSISCYSEQTCNRIRPIGEDFNVPVNINRGLFF